MFQSRFIGKKSCHIPKAFLTPSSSNTLLVGTLVHRTSTTSNAVNANTPSPITSVVIHGREVLIKHDYKFVIKDSVNT